MSSGVPINSARPVTFASAELAVANAIKTSFATSTSVVTLVPADLNGSGVSSSTGHIARLPRSITITRSNNVGQFSTGAIVITGRYGGKDVTETLTPGNANGNDTLRGTQAFDQILSIAIPAQGGTGGTFTIGVQDIVAHKGDRFSGVELSAAGTLNAQYGEGSGAQTDATPIAAAQAGTIKPVSPTRILTNPTLSSPTTVGLTVYVVS